MRAIVTAKWGRMAAQIKASHRPGSYHGTPVPMAVAIAAAGLAAAVAHCLVRVRHAR